VANGELRELGIVEKQAWAWRTIAYAQRVMGFGRKLLRSVASERKETAERTLLELGVNPWDAPDDWPANALIPGRKEQDAAARCGLMPRGIDLT